MKLVIGTIVYNENTAKYLPYFFESLRKQNFIDYKVLAYDHSDYENNNNKDFINKNTEGIEIVWPGKNLGFARAHNLMIKRANELGAEYYLAINPDMIFEKDFINFLVKALDKDKNLASTAPKILKWDFINKKKTNIIDSCGIKQISALRFRDIGQGDIDKGQFNDAQILGPTGAAAMYRISALKSVSNKQEYFDELMFMYEEDCDLNYRLNLAQFKSKLVPDAITYHDRTARAKGVGNIQVAFNRKNKSRQVKKWAFLNKHIIFIKHWHTINFIGKIDVLWFASRMFIFVLLFEQYLLKEYVELWKLRRKIIKFR